MYFGERRNEMHLHMWDASVYVVWTDGSTVLLGCKEGLLRGSSAPLLPLFSLTHYPGGSVLALQSGLLLLLINLQRDKSTGRSDC